jgi:hypothetical protein
MYLTIRLVSGEGWPGLLRWKKGQILFGFLTGIGPAIDSEQSPF